MKGLTRVDYLKIIHWNVEGINSQIFGNKTDHDSFNRIIAGHDIIALTETQCDENTQISLPDYWVLRNTRPKHKRPKNTLEALQFV